MCEPRRLVTVFDETNYVIKIISYITVTSRVGSTNVWCDQGEDKYEDNFHFSTNIEHSVFYVLLTQWMSEYMQQKLLYVSFNFSGNFNFVGN